MKKSSLPKWKQKLTKAQLKHLKETTERSTLAEFKRNREAQVENNFLCVECAEIARRGGVA